METEYIVEATNRVHGLLLETVKPNQACLEKVFAIGCNTLMRAVAQADVSEDLRRLQKIQANFSDEYREIVGNAAHFVNGFCVIEKRVMLAAGINEGATDLLIQEAIALREAVRDLKINPDQVFDDIKNLSNTYCEIARELYEFPKKKDEQRRVVKKFKRVFAAIGGIAIVGINASALAVTIGLSAPGSAVSVGVGCALIGAALIIE